jgi:glutamine amidotransferase
MEVLKARGLDKAMHLAAAEGKTIIGICLGMQLLLSKSYEFGETEGLNLVPGNVLPFKNDTELRVPHMGWNEATTTDQDFHDFNGDYYFVHSFYCDLKDKSDVLFTTDYGLEYCSGLKRGDKIFGFQFHPEKSQELGLLLLNQTLKYAQN